MRVAVLADIHGNLPALEAVLADADVQGAERFVVLGDLADRGPFPAEVLALVRERASAVVRGNTDAQLVAYQRGDAPAAWYQAAQFAPVRWTCARLSRADSDFLAGLPFDYVLAAGGLPPVRFVHASPRSVSEPTYPDRTLRAEDALALIPEMVLGTGHIHVPWVARSAAGLAFNPGAVGQPFNGDPRAQFALLIGEGGAWRVEHRALDYDRASLCEAFHERGLLAQDGAFARAAMASMMTGRDEIRPFLKHAAGLAGDERDWHDGLLPDPIWQRAAETYDWETAERGSECIPSSSR